MTLTEPKTTSPAPENLAAAEKMLAPGGASESPVPERSSLLERAVRSRLKRIVSGSLTIETPSGSERFGKPARPAAADVVVSAGGSLERANPDAHGTVVVHDERFWTALALRGSVGAGEAYAYGWWTSPEPTDVVRVLVANHTARQGGTAGGQGHGLSESRQRVVVQPLVGHWIPDLERIVLGVGAKQGAVCRLGGEPRGAGSHHRRRTGRCWRPHH